MLTAKDLELSHKVSPTQHPKYEMNKGNDRHVKVEGETPQVFNLTQGVTGN